MTLINLPYKTLDRLATVYTLPVLCLAAVVALWIGVLSRIDADIHALERTALRDVAAQAQAYEHFVHRSLSQLDQTTMQLKYDWEKSAGTLRFSDLLRQGMFTEQAIVSVSIYDRKGARTTSTRMSIAPAWIGDDPAFRFHSNNISTALRMTLPDAGTRRHQQIAFSRRLDTPDDTFDGVLVMLIDADFFTSFYSAKTFGSAGLLAIVDTEDDRSLDFTPTQPKQAAALWSHPHANIHGDDGATLVAAATFGDHQARYVAWRKSDAYPFIAVTGVTRAELMSAAEQNFGARRANAVITTLGLALFAIISYFLARRMVRGRREAESVRQAYRMATDHASDGFYMATPMYGPTGQIIDFTIVDCNARGASFFSLTRDEMIGARLSSVPPQTGNEGLVKLYASAMEKGFLQSDVRMPSDRRIRLAWAQRTLVRAGNGLAVTLHDISRHKKQEQDLVRLANEDVLTGLPNRYWLHHYLPTAIERARGNATQIGLLFVDLDGFKHVNDTQGHDAGDMLLKIAAQRLTGLLRPTDHVVRFGGDEFIILIDPLESIGMATAIAQRVLDAFAHAFDIDCERQIVGASVGISLYPKDASDAMTLIKSGDIAMYAGKTDGKGQYRLYETALFEGLKSKGRDRLELIDAIDQDQLVLHYQPRVDTATGALCSMEALVRWAHPVRGLIAPLHFVPLAEATGLIGALGERVMEMACRQIAQWRNSGIDVVPVSINVSPFQFRSASVSQQLRQHLAFHRIDAALLEVEITESAMLGDDSDILVELAAIRALGVRLHIDDFGTGYSSLGQLQKLKMDVLKVDRAFTNELGRSRDGEIFFEAIVSMAHALGMTVVAEGVETREQWDILRKLDCNEIQGYLISRPIPAEDMARMMTTRTTSEALCPPA